MCGTRSLRRIIERRGLGVRFIPFIRYGTERYPEKVARRLRAVNIAALIAAASSSFFSIQAVEIPRHPSFGDLSEA